MDIEQAIAIAKECGFETAAPLSVDTLHANPEVRGMCAKNKCHRYDNSWSCPPACGTVEECEARMHGFEHGILVQSVGELEDEWDIEGMQEVEKNHKERFDKAVMLWHEAHGGKLLPLTAGSCTRCKECTYPDAPCRFPDLQMQSMEAYCLLVSEICTLNGVPYNYGKNRLAYTGCMLF